MFGKRLQELEEDLSGRGYIPISVQIFPQSWSSTAGPLGGVGGQSITVYNTYVFEVEFREKYIVYYEGKLAYAVDNPNDRFFQDLTSQSLHHLPNIYQ